MLKPGDRIKRFARITAWTLGPILGILLVLMIFPRPIPKLPGESEKPLSFEDAVRAMEQYDAPISYAISDPCFSTVLHHNQKTKKVAVLLHGLSNCPAQFQRVGQALHKQGYNVVIPRMPHHGLKNRLNEEYGTLTLKEMAAWVGGVLDIAHGLGDEVTVAGLSVNGNTAIWIAMDRPDVDRVVVISPFLAPAGIPGFLQGPLGRLLARMPNLFLWWDAELKQEIKGPEYVYPRFPTRVVGEFMVLGSALVGQATRQAPEVKDLVMVLSDADQAIDLAMARQLVKSWQKWEGANVEEIIFPKQDAVPHDMVDPNQPDQRIDLAEPVLIRAITGKSVSEP